MDIRVLVVGEKGLRAEKGLLPKLGGGKKEVHFIFFF